MKTIVALALCPFVALGMLIVCVCTFPRRVWRESRGIVRDLELQPLVQQARGELDEERAARRSLAGKAWKE